ncbi:MAG: hypothetical protein KatS3mg082_1400 [Nitrospiraceae bacterium]|nr:MAG: hypothetical protein KatS3mg082_1400 [Nitrospiraceae bacterium]
MTNTHLIVGDALDVLQRFPDASFDSMVTDPPYGLSNHTPAKVIETLRHWLDGDDSYVPSGRGFMGRAWDAFVPPPAVWKECLRVLKPGAYACVFASTRSADLMGISLRLAGFEVRDTIEWVYGSGFPKSLDLGKAVDKKLGRKRKVIGQGMHTNIHAFADKSRYTGTAVRPDITVGDSEWEGWGTALKPAHEPILLVRKPIAEKSVVDNVLKWRTGGINVGECRVGDDEVVINKLERWSGFGQVRQPDYESVVSRGRFPANLIHDGSKEASRGFPENGEPTRFFYTAPWSDEDARALFYCAKANRKERGRDNPHPTVKPVALMAYLVRLVTPKGGVVLDPFIGSGTTAVACEKLGFRCVGIEFSPAYAEIAQKRLAATRAEMPLFASQTTETPSE